MSFTLHRRRTRGPAQTSQRQLRPCMRHLARYMRHRRRRMWEPRRRMRHLGFGNQAVVKPAIHKAAAAAAAAALVVAACSRHTGAPDQVQRLVRGHGKSEGALEDGGASVALPQLLLRRRSGRRAGGSVIRWRQGWPAGGVWQGGGKVSCRVADSCLPTARHRHWGAPHRQEGRGAQARALLAGRQAGTAWQAGRGAAPP